MTTVTCADLLQPIAAVVGCGPELWPDGGYVNGSPATPVAGVLVTWMADLAALERAAALGCNVVFCHESPYFAEKAELPPYRWLNAEGGQPEEAWHPNRRRREFLQAKGLTLVQCHYGLDRFPIYQTFAETLALGPVVHDQGWESVYRLPEAVPLAALAATVKQRLGIAGTVRVVGDVARPVQQVALFWGGIGLNVNAYWGRRAREHGADVGICGEMDEYSMKYAREAGLALIETSHQLSEEFGLCRYAAVLAEHYPGLRVETCLGGRPYVTL